MKPKKQLSAIKRLLDEARKHIGYAEGKGNRTKFAAALDSEEVPPIPRQGSPWCGTFVDYVFKRSGNWPAMQNVSMFATQAGLKRAEKQGRVIRNLGDLTLVRPGDVMVKTYSQWAGHTGIVEEVDPFFGTITTIEGNTSLNNDRNGGSVMRRVRSATYWNAAVLPDWRFIPSAVTEGDGLKWLPAIDVAKYQGDIDWDQVKQAGVELAIIKVHNTREVDPKAGQNVLGAIQAKVSVAGYWYARSWLDRDPGTQALADIDMALELDPHPLFLMADIESGENCPLTPECIDWWNRYIAALPEYVWLYGGSNYLAKFDQELVSRHPVITARYPRQGPNPRPSEWDEHALALPHPQWPTEFEWAGWQFTSSGIVPGIYARTDLNIIRRSALGWPTDPPGDHMSSLKIIQEAGKPALYLASSDGIAYRWIKGQDDLAFVRFILLTGGHNADIQEVPAGQLHLFGALVGPAPIQ